MTYLLVALLAIATGWCWGHRTARVRVIFVGATQAQDDESFLADEAVRFWQLVNTIDLTDEEQQ
ncbi:hypothetical protein ACSLFT_28595 [Streptomyces sp. G6]|uniref:hypothetical protein n=1 Tax=Streptomyces sp. G6 TaxID=1178736 RepID=UPI003EDB4511